MEHQGSLASPLGTWVALSNDGIIGTFIKAFNARPNTVESG